MKKNLNVIQIRGIRGLIMAGLIACCLAVGFIGFPGWICMKLWNIMASYIYTIPSIGIFQGLLLWGIIIAAYFAFKKDKVVVCFKTPQGLTDEELKEVFEDMKRQSIQDPILQAMAKAREAELKIKTEENNKEDNETVTTGSESKS